MTNLSILKNDANEYLEAFVKLATLLGSINYIQRRYTLNPNWRWKYKLIFKDGNYKKYYTTESIELTENGFFSEWCADEESERVTLKYTYFDGSCYESYGPDFTSFKISFPKEWLDEDPNSLIENYEKEIKESWEACKKEEKELIAKKKK